MPILALIIILILGAVGVYIIIREVLSNPFVELKTKAEYPSLALQEIRKQKCPLKILSGELNPQSWGENEEVIRTIREIAKETMVEIICGPQFYINNYKIVALLQAGAIHLYRLPQRPEHPHFLLIGESIVLYHDLSACGGGMWYDKRLTIRLQRRFEEIKRQAKEVKAENFFEMFSFFIRIGEDIRPASETEISEMRAKVREELIEGRYV